MGFVLLEKDGWPGLVQLSFLEREDSKIPLEEAARVLLEDILEERDVPFPREAVKVENRGDMGIATLDYTYAVKDEPAHWRIWFLVDRTRALMAAYVCAPAYDKPALAEVTRIIEDIEFIPSMND